MDKIVLDSNVILLGLRGENAHAKVLIDNLQNITSYDFRISSLIFEEVHRNLPQLEKEKFKNLLKSRVLKLEIYRASDDSIYQYKAKGLKRWDAEIAAFVESINALYLISQNRHFLKELKTSKFKVVDAEGFIKEVLK